MKRKPYHPYRWEYRHARFRRRTWFETAKHWVHEHTPYIGVRLDDFLP